MIRTTAASVGFLLACSLLSFGLAEIVVRNAVTISPYVCQSGSALVIKPDKWHLIGNTNRNTWECDSADGTSRTCWRCFLVFVPMLLGFPGCIAIAWMGWLRRKAVLDAMARLDVQRAMGFGSEGEYEQQRRDLEKRLDRAD